VKVGDEAVELARSAGLELDEWQAFVLRESLRRRKDGRWSAFEVGLNVSRQNGKGAILEARELAGLFLLGEGLIVHSAHQFDTSMEAFLRMEQLLEEADLIKELRPRAGISRSHGAEGFVTKSGPRLRYRTRTKGGGRGFSCDCLILDEAMVISEMAHGALLPTLSARENPQVWYTGSAVDQLVHEHGVVFTRVRERGIKGDDPALAYFEWSVANETADGAEAGPGQVSQAVADDQAAWAQANPALGIRITAEHVGYERRSMDPRTFAVERLGIGDWPRTDHVGDSPLDWQAWRLLEDELSVLQNPICLAFDVSPDRRASIAAAGRNQDGVWHVEIVEDRGGTGWLAARVAELVRSHRPTKVVCDGYGPAASLIPAVEKLDVQVETLTAGEHGQACGQLVDLVEQKALRHLGSTEIATAVRSASTRPLGDAWAWSRRNSTANISPLVSATLALSAAVTSVPESAEPLIAWG
jgi:hypothetical protein